MTGPSDTIICVEWIYEDGRRESCCRGFEKEAVDFLMSERPPLTGQLMKPARNDKRPRQRPPSSSSDGAGSLTGSSPA